jgi:hypothetical protein
MNNKPNKITNSNNQIPGNIIKILRILDEMNDHNANLRNKISSLFHNLKTNSASASKLNSSRDKDNNSIR